MFEMCKRDHGTGKNGRSNAQSGKEETCDSPTFAICIGPWDFGQHVTHGLQVNDALTRVRTRKSVTELQQCNMDLSPMTAFVLTHDEPDDLMWWAQSFQ